MGQEEIIRKQRNNANLSANLSECAQLGDQCQDFWRYTDIQKIQAVLLQ